MNTQNTIQKTFNYEGNAITFQSGNGVMVNATEMAKSFGKRVPEWTRLQSTKDFLDNLWTLRSGQDPEVQKMHYDIEQYNDAGLKHIFKSFDKDLHLIVTSTGGQTQGTWMHEDVALEFARWLSPKFAIWCNDRIKELLTNGVAYNIPQTYADALALAAEQAKALELQAAQLNEANATIESQNETIAEQKPKADYYDEVLQQQNTYTFTDIAKELGMRSGHELIERLTNRGIVYRKYGKILAYVKYSNQGYFTTRTDLYTTPDGRRGVNYSTVVTEKGREWMHTDYQPATQTTLSL